jgi:hypothetical protein
MARLKARSQGAGMSGSDGDRAAAAVAACKHGRAQDAQLGEWFSRRRFLGLVGNAVPAEFEAVCSQEQASPCAAAGHIAGRPPSRETGAIHERFLRM